jgi:hypothetical protein
LTIKTSGSRRPKTHTDPDPQNATLPKTQGIGSLNAVKSLVRIRTMNAQCLTTPHLVLEEVEEELPVIEGASGVPSSIADIICKEWDLVLN